MAAAEPVTRDTIKVCTKNRFARRRDAIQRITYLRTHYPQGHERDKLVKAYECPDCGQWHIGHRQKNRNTGGQTAISAER